jgi:hypothetical protein
MPSQIIEKYTNLGRDALSAGDYVMAESFFQHAEHYRRMHSVKKEERPEGTTSEKDAVVQPAAHETLDASAEPTSIPVIDPLQKPENRAKIEQVGYQEPSSPVRSDDELPAFLAPRRPRMDTSAPSQGSTVSEAEEPKRPIRRRISRPRTETTPAQDA